jgi:N-glycosylase/DNA lyase
MMDNNTVKLAEVLRIERLVKPQFRAVGSELVHTHALHILSRSALIFAEKLLQHNLIENVAGRENYQA